MNTPAATYATENGFDSYYAGKIEPALVALEALRKKRVRFMTGLAGLGVIGFGAIAILAQTGQSDGPIALAAFAVGFGGMLGAGLAYLGLTDRYKQVLTGGVCAYLGFEYTLRKFEFPLPASNRSCHFTQASSSRIGSADILTAWISSCARASSRKRRPSGGP